MPAGIDAARAAHDAGDWVEAARVYTELIERSPQDEAALYGMGLLCRDLGKYREALELFRRAMDVAAPPHKLSYRLDLAAAYLAEGRAAECLAECELVRDQQHEPNAELHWLQGQAFAALGDHVAALQCFAEGSACFPERLDLHWARAELLFAQQDWQNASAAYEVILGQEPRHAPSLLRATSIMLQQASPIEEPWVARLRSIIPLVSQDDLRRDLRLALAACHDRRGEHSAAAAVRRQLGVSS